MPPKKKEEKYSMDWLQEGIWYGPANTDDRISENVQNIQQSHKLYNRTHERQESGINSGRKN